MAMHIVISTAHSLEQDIGNLIVKRCISTQLAQTLIAFVVRPEKLSSSWLVINYILSAVITC